MKHMKPVAGDAKMNRAESRMPHSGHDKPAASAAMRASDVGNETKADMKGALLGQPTDGNPLCAAKHELHSQHPHHYSDHGPHHGTKSHVRHEPLHGMKPGYGR